MYVPFCIQWYFYKKKNDLYLIHVEWNREYHVSHIQNKNN